MSLVAAAILLVGACGGGSHAASSATRSDAETTSASSSAPPLTVDAYVALARTICNAGQQQVYDEVSTVLHYAQFPDEFPSDSFVQFHRQTHTIGVDVIAKLREIPVPSGDDARRDSDLAVMGSAVKFASAAGRAAAENDKAAYSRLVSAPAPHRQTDGLLPAECLYLSLGPGAGR